jgi:4,5-DOPA dioxygenase extradiol
MPTIFVGHGSPMHVLTENKYRNSWVELGLSLPKPRAILCISAHWETATPELCTAQQPETIHDFYGFPSELYEITYPAPGAPFLLEEIRSLTGQKSVSPNSNWGLDHGAWSVLCSLFPKADIPVTQLSLAKSFSFADHFAFASQLTPLRHSGVMVVCSGNITHNLRLLGDNKPVEWALDFDAYVTRAIVNNDTDALIDYRAAGNSSHLAVPTAEHYIPVLYAAGLREQADTLRFFVEGFDLGSLSMRSFVLEQQP